MPELTTPAGKPAKSFAGVPPQYVALVRGILVAVVIGILVAVAHALTGVDLSSVPPVYRPLILALLGIVARVLEGFADKLRGQAPQAGPFGSAPADPLSYAVATPPRILDPAVDTLIYGTEQTDAQLRAIAEAAAKRLAARHLPPGTVPAR